MSLVELIVQRKIPAVIVYEDETIIAFMDINPINRGHMLICPKEKYESFIDVPEHIILAVMAVAKKLYAKVTEELSPDGVCFMQNNGHYNELGHYHLHLYPRHKGDKFRWMTCGLGIQTQEQLGIDAKNLTL